eukprot:4193588-Pyramimonas_sp.AAC.1
MGIATTWKRVIHVLCPFGKAFISTSLDPSGQINEHEFAQGCVPRRRRETAMMVQQSVGWRLRRL